MGGYHISKTFWGRLKKLTLTNVNVDVTGWQRSKDAPKPMDTQMMDDDEEVPGEVILFGKDQL